MLSLIVRKTPAKAKIVRWNQTPCLLARFSTSTPPMVWQMDLEKVTNYTLTVVEHEGNWDVGYTVPQGAFTLIAHFDDRMDAEYAYDTIQNALLRGSPRSSLTNGAGGFFGKFVLFVAVVFALWLAVSLYLSNSRQPTTNVAQTLGSTPEMSSMIGLDHSESAAPSTPKEMEIGVPVTADDVLPKN